ncbi:MAG: hypothetical protein IT237_05220 [Bacteroidia bacterium]|nr:hypothetical protein [Bacteroidia bacterium]
MKKITAFAICLFITASCYSHEVYVTKSKGGLFGYKYVEQTSMNNGQVFLTCTDPGWTKCRYSSGAKITYKDISIDISLETLNIIDETVIRNITESKLNGKFIFDNTFFVIYKYNLETDKLEYSIYLIEEANDKGLI